MIGKQPPNPFQLIDISTYYHKVPYRHSLTRDVSVDDQLIKGEGRGRVPLENCCNSCLIMFILKTFDLKYLMRCGSNCFEDGPENYF